MNPILTKFNTKVQTLSQSGGKQLLLSAREARDLQSEIFVLLRQIATLEANLRRAESGEVPASISADGGKF